LPRDGADAGAALFTPQARAILRYVAAYFAGNISTFSIIFDGYLRLISRRAYQKDIHITPDVAARCRRYAS